MPDDVIVLRRILASDLPQMYEMQLDEESNRIAGTIPRTADVFESHWINALSDPSVTARAILLGDEFAGVISCFWLDGEANIGYWIGRDHWGKGVATRALKLFLVEVKIRPLYATAATDNTASLKVLRKCGFVIRRTQHSPRSERFLEREVAILMLAKHSLADGLNIA